MLIKWFNMVFCIQWMLNNSCNTNKISHWFIFHLNGKKERHFLLRKQNKKTSKIHCFLFFMPKVKHLNYFLFLSIKIGSGAYNSLPILILAVSFIEVNVIRAEAKSWKKKFLFIWESTYMKAKFPNKKMNSSN